MAAKFKAHAEQAATEEPVFSLPPFKVEQIFTTHSEAQDWGLKLMGIPSLWRVTKGAGVKVAVLDTGIALNHPDLREGVVKAKDFTRSKSGPGDQQGHGTHCAGVIGARENATGVVGVAPECGFLIGKVLGDNGSGSLQAVAAGIDWAVAEKADVISMSLGSPQGHPTLEAAIKRAVAAGVFVVCAAGNEGPTLDTVGYPAMYPDVVSVGAIDQNKKIASFSSRGNRVDICAPGVDILSDYPPRNLAKLSGTSMACPFVAGVIALMVAKRRKYGSDSEPKTAKEMIKKLRDTAIDAGPVGYDPAYGFGLINPAVLVERPLGGLTLVAADDLTESGRAKVQAFYGELRDVKVA